MLVLSRFRDESIQIGPDITVTLLEIRDGNRCRLGIRAPDEVTIDRSEVFEAKVRDGEYRNSPRETAARLLSELDGRDSEACHKQADQILLAFLRANGNAAVADAWEEAKSRVGFWYS